MREKIIKNMVNTTIKTYGLENEKSVKMATVYENYLNNRLTFLEACRLFDELAD